MYTITFYRRANMVQANITLKDASKLTNVPLKVHGVCLRTKQGRMQCHLAPSEPETTEVEATQQVDEYDVQEDAPEVNADEVAQAVHTEDSSDSEESADSTEEDE
jgi:hypothetical protein